jgi:SAM-dependent methyltransferase
MLRPLYDQLVPYYELIEGRDWNSELKLIVSILRTNRSVTVVDLGCGPGYHVRALAKLGFDATGVDISRQNILFARRKARQEKVQPRFVVGSYYNYRPRELADAALCLNWSIPTRDDELHRFLRNTRSILRIGGILILDYERVSDVVWKDLSKPIVNSWRLNELLIVRVSVGQLISHVLRSRDVYILYPKHSPDRSPNEVARYRSVRNAKSVEVYVDSSYVRFFSIPELRQFAAKSAFRLASNHVLPRNSYKRNYAVLKRIS